MSDPKQIYHYPIFTYDAGKVGEVTARFISMLQLDYRGDTAFWRDLWQHVELIWHSRTMPHISLTVRIILYFPVLYALGSHTQPDLTQLW